MVVLSATRFSSLSTLLAFTFLNSHLLVSALPTTGGISLELLQRDTGAIYESTFEARAINPALLPPKPATKTEEKPSKGKDLGPTGQCNTVVQHMQGVTTRTPTKMTWSKCSSEGGIGWNYGGHCYGMGSAPTGATGEGTCFFPKKAVLPPGAGGGSSSHPTISKKKRNLDHLISLYARTAIIKPEVKKATGESEAKSSTDFKDVGPAGRCNAVHQQMTGVTTRTPASMTWSACAGGGGVGWKYNGHCYGMDGAASSGSTGKGMCYFPQKAVLPPNAGGSQHETPVRQHGITTRELADMIELYIRDGGIDW